MTNELVHQCLTERKRSLALTASQHYGDIQKEKEKSLFERRLKFEGYNKALREMSA
jgi:hypothetical protein